MAENRACGMEIFRPARTETAGGRTVMLATLRSVSIVVSQQATEPLPAHNVAFVATDFVPRLDDLIVEPLVIAFFVVVVQIRVHGATQGLFAEEDHAGKTLGFDAEVKSFNA